MKDSKRTMRKHTRSGLETDVGVGPAHDGENAAPGELRATEPCVLPEWERARKTAIRRGEKKRRGVRGGGGEAM